MTQIAHARRFDGTDDTIQVGTTGLAGGHNALTYAAIVRLNADVSGGRGIFFLDDGFTDGEFGLSYDGDLNAVNRWAFPPASNDYWDNDTLTHTMGWCLICATKAAATEFTRYHRYVYSTTTWTHADSSGLAMGAITSAATPELWLGSYSNSSNYWSGDIACVGIKLGTELSDSAVEDLADEIAAWDAFADSVWLLDQESTSTAVEDRVGSNDQVSIVGTSVVSVSDLPFDVGGDPTPTWGSHRRAGVAGVA